MQNYLSMYIGSLVIALVLSTPMLMMVNSSIEHTVNTVLDEATKMAADQGHFTADLIEDEIYKRLEERNISRTTVQFSGTQDITTRGNYIEAEITVPRTPIILFAVFGSDPEDITKSTRLMSEYTPN